MSFEETFLHRHEFLIAHSLRRSRNRLGVHPRTPNLYGALALLGRDLLR